MRDPDDWKFPTNPQSKHPAAEVTRLREREERVSRDIDRWRSQAQTRRPAQAAASRAAGLMRSLALLVGLLGLLAAAGVWLVTNAYRDRISPTVVAGDVPLGSLTRDQATDKLQERLRGYLDAPVTLKLGETTWQPSAADLGIDVNIPATVDKAARAGRNRNAAISMLDTSLGRERPTTVPVVLTLDRERMNQYLTDIGTSIDRDKVSPTLKVTGAGVRIEGGGPAFRFLQEETEADLLRSLASLSRRPVDVRVYSDKGPLSPQEIAQAEQTAKQIVSASITLAAGERRWQITQQQLRDWVRSDSGQASGSGGKIEVLIDPVQLRTLLAGVAREVDHPARNARLQWVAGELQVAKPSESGEELELDSSADVVQQAARGDRRTVELPFRNIAPEISEGSISSLGISELVATGESGFQGSPPERIDNIRRASEAVTGYVVPAGAVFSFGDAIGVVSEDAAYKPELVGDGQRNIQGPLTGISQVSTAVFRAAWQAGLPVLERHAADRRYEYYGQKRQTPGTEAVVTLPGDDLRFENSTTSAILVQVLVDAEAGEMRVELYGTKPDWTVELGRASVENVVQPTGEVVWTDPFSADSETRRYLHAEAGADVTVARRVKQGSEVLLDDSLFTKYAPLPAVVVRGTG